MSSSVRKAIIPAAGLGTRMLPISHAVPKEMLPIVDLPAVYYLVEEAVRSGIQEILIITNRDKDFPAMQVMNTIFGAGMTSKLFMNVRENLSLCYSVGSSYYGTKGIITVSAGIDFDKEELTRQEIEKQLNACKNGDITEEELISAKQALLSSLRASHDSPGAIEGYYSTAALSGMPLTVAQYMAAVEAVTVEQVAAAARMVAYHSSFFLKGGCQ